MILYLSLLFLIIMTAVISFWLGYRFAIWKYDGDSLPDRKEYVNDRVRD